MELMNEFRVPVPVDQAWAILTDVERIAPCMPGAQLQEVDGDEYRGIVKVKVGPITAQYKGKAKFIELDEANHKAVLEAEGRETRGQGNATAAITATLKPDGDGTRVSIVTDLAVTGRVAQFGRGVLADVSGKLIDQFVACLESDVLSGDHVPASVPSTVAETQRAAPAPAAQPEPAPIPSAPPPSGPRTIDSRPAQPVDLLQTAGAPVAKRLLPLAAVLFLVLLFLRRRRRP
jgi:carbon monoxide dehydrogenase subunit G